MCGFLPSPLVWPVVGWMGPERQLAPRARLAPRAVHAPHSAEKAKQAKGRRNRQEKAKAMMPLQGQQQPARPDEMKLAPAAVVEAGCVRTTLVVEAEATAEKRGDEAQQKGKDGIVAMLTLASSSKLSGAIIKKKARHRKTTVRDAADATQRGR